MDPALETHDLTRSFGGENAVDGISIHAQPGEVLTLLGPNGAGKTTTVRLLNGILRPDRGSARVLGLDPTVEGDLLRRRTGVLTEFAGLDDRLSARENLQSAADIRRLGEVGDRITELLERFGMGERADKPVEGASTGQRKRLALARELLHDPDLLFLDEPTSGLDPHATRDVVQLIGRLANDHGRTVVLCTHFLGEAGRLADRMAIMARGRILSFGTPAELASGLWRGVMVSIDAHRPLRGDELDAARDVRGVQQASATESGAALVVDHDDVVPMLVRALVERDVPVHGCVPQRPTLEDIYFAVLEQHGLDADPAADETEEAAAASPWPHLAGRAR